jgi:MoaA/NifB/PqqE/SkfB family radical SAM enzyme
MSLSAWVRERWGRSRPQIDNSPTKRAERALDDVLRRPTQSLGEIVLRLQRTLERDPANGPLIQTIAEAHAATGDFQSGRRLHLRAIQNDGTLARHLKNPTFSPLEKPAVLCAISNICNINCRICETQNSRVAKGNMDFELAQSIIDQCKTMGVGTIILHHVNEPLLHPQIFDILNYLEDHGMSAVISTNGNEMASVNRRAGKQKRLPTKLEIRYSVDGGRRDTYNEIRRGGDFDTVVSGVSALAQFCQERGISLSTGSNYVMTSKSIQELADFYEVFSRYIPPEKMYFSVVGGNTPTGLNKYIIDNRVVDFVRRTPCDVPFSQLNILRDGRVSLCCVDFNEEAIIGDARTTPLVNLWRGNEALERQREALASQDVDKLHPICKRCFVSSAIYADGPLNAGIQQMFALKKKGVRVENTHIYNRIRFEFLMHGFDVAETSKPLRLYENGNEFVDAHAPQAG